jgi:hypothetical protein
VVTVVVTGDDAVAQAFFILSSHAPLYPFRSSSSVGPNAPFRCPGSPEASAATITCPGMPTEEQYPGRGELLLGQEKTPSPTLHSLRSPPSATTLPSPARRRFERYWS